MAQTKQSSSKNSYHQLFSRMEELSAPKQSLSGPKFDRRTRLQIKVSRDNYWLLRLRGVHATLKNYISSVGSKDWQAVSAAAAADNIAREINKLCAARYPELADFYTQIRAAERDKAIIPTRSIYLAESKTLWTLGEDNLYRLVANIRTARADRLEYIDSLGAKIMPDKKGRRG